MIIVGYQGIGKTTLSQRRNEYIDLESGNFFVNGKRAPDWYIPYCNIADNISRQGKHVFVASHAIVRGQLARFSGERKVIVYPAISLKDQWLNKLADRWDYTKEAKDYRAYMNAKDLYEANIRELMEADGFEKIELQTMDYNLADELDRICGMRGDGMFKMSAEILDELADAQPALPLDPVIAVRILALHNGAKALRELSTVKTELEAEIARYRQWVDDLQSGMYVNCVYCGHRYGPADKVPTSMAEALKQHVEQCPKHPMSALKAELDKIKADHEAMKAEWQDAHNELKRIRAERDAAVADIEEIMRDPNALEACAHCTGPCRMTENQKSCNPKWRGVQPGGSGE